MSDKKLKISCGGSIGPTSYEHPQLIGNAPPDLEAEAEAYACTIEGAYKDGSPVAREVVDHFLASVARCKALGAKELREWCRERAIQFDTPFTTGIMAVPLEMIEKYFEEEGKT